MNLFFDSSVLVPVFLPKHIHHTASKAAFQQGRREDRSCGAQSLDEFYSTFTGFPNRFSADRNDVLLSIGDILEHLSIVTLTPDEYVLAIQDAARDGSWGHRL